MKTSSFLYGAIFGAAAYRMISRNRNMSFASMLKGANLSNLAGTAKEKMMNCNSNQGSGRQESVRPSPGGSDSSSYSSGNQHGVQASTNSKATNLKQVKDFIRSNPDIKHEVEQILKETHTVIPGL
ncbi:hypothetical protein MNQ98_10965 [Paenibacillus sp. N3/727]|uniref:hypothetical protein n=1 Tax=Paenibacillus sp. N3/727 TaxID=2925845 RepID=UPI001F5366CF|nr:hypothetical protein [Paenibacillus sp. N3/727]UNK20493.1 hypothetical protein MNQ98_10965 [Paenibacillus sp. N3/727]